MIQSIAKKKNSVFLKSIISNTIINFEPNIVYAIIYID